MKIFYIDAYNMRGGNCYVGYDNNPCNSLDMAMTFTSEEEAEKTKQEIQKEWKGSKLEVNFTEFEEE